MSRRKANVLKKNQDSITKLILLAVLFLLLSLIIPAIGAGPNAPALWVDIVAFFASVQSHFVDFWMFYSFAVLVLFTYFGKKK